MKSNYDFSKAKKNPYKNTLKKGYSVTVHYKPDGDVKTDPPKNDDERTDPQKGQKIG